MSITCNFQLTRASNIYYSGEYIEGTVTLCPLKLRQVEAAVHLQFYGQTNVAWLDLDKTTAADHIGHNDFSTREVSVKTLYSNQQKHVCDHHKLASLQLLQPQVVYKYKFSFLIPQQAAATSRCPLGECEYGVQVIVRRSKKVNKEFHQRIVVKNKLDLLQNIAYREPSSVSNQNSYGQIVLTTPCTGFTPGQKIPYHLKCQASQTNCKILIQLCCSITCHSTTPHYNLKHIKKAIDVRKHPLGEIVGHLNLPLDSQITRELCEDSILKFQYYIEALLIEGNKKILLTTTLPLTIGTTPCFNSYDMETTDIGCYDNYGSSHAESTAANLNLTNIHTTQPMIQQLYESMWMLPIKRNTHLRRSLRYCYKKIVKLI